MNLRYLVALRWSSEPPSDITVNYGQRIDMKCSADGNPKPKIEWFKLFGESSELQVSLLSNI